MIGIVAAFEHEQDIKKLKIGRVLKAILERNPAVMVVALGCDVGRSGPRYQRHTMVPFEQLLQVERGFDIGLGAADRLTVRARLLQRQGEGIRGRRGDVARLTRSARTAVWARSRAGCSSSRAIGSRRSTRTSSTIAAASRSPRERALGREQARSRVPGRSGSRRSRPAQMLARDGSGGGGASTAVAAGAQRAEPEAVGPRLLRPNAVDGLLQYRLPAVSSSRRSSGCDPTRPIWRRAPRRRAASSTSWRIPRTTRRRRATRPPSSSPRPW